eukprot:3860688-Amphidinium_carterae.1
MHTDDSDVTFNVCLGVEFKGALSAHAHTSSWSLFTPLAPCSQGIPLVGRSFSLNPTALQTFIYKVHMGTGAVLMYVQRCRKAGSCKSKDSGDQPIHLQSPHLF